jgi:hypothetical protein
MRVLVSTTAGSGHFGPLVPFATACRQAGHDVLVAAPASFAAEVEAAGFAHRPFADAPPEVWGPIMARLPHLTFDEAEAVVLGEIFAGADVRAALADVVAAVDEWRPDVILREEAELASHLAAERSAVPEVRVAIGLGLMETVALPIFAEALAPVRAEVGLDGDVDVVLDRLRAAPWCSLTPPSLEYPASPGPPMGRRYRSDASRGAAPLGQWWPEDMAARPLVYLTFGTVALTIPTFATALPAVLRAVADLPVRLLVTIGRAGDPADLGRVPANVHVEQWVPQADVLPHAAAIVCHGGYGTVLGSLAAGVPLVVAPQFADQPYNAERVAAVGAGVALPLRPPAADDVREMVETVLGDDGYRRAATAMADEIGGLPLVEHAVAPLEALAGK